MVRDKGFVSVLGVGIVLGVAITYAMLIQYVSQTSEFSDVYVKSLFSDIDNIYSTRVSEVNYGVYSKSSILSTLNKSLSSSGMLCSRGTYEYGGMRFYNGVYVIAEVGDKVSVFPPLIYSGMVKRYVLPEDGKSAFIVYSSSLEVDGCSYDVVFEEEYNKYVKLKGINFENEGCVIKSERDFIINVYPFSIDPLFYRSNYLSLIHNFEFPIEILSLPEEKLNDLRNKIIGSFDASLVSDPLRSVMSLEDIMFLEDTVLEEINDLYDSYYLDEVLEAEENIKRTLEFSPNQEIRDVIDSYSKKVDEFFDPDVMELFNLPTGKEMFADLVSVDEDTKNVVVELLSKYSLKDVLAWDDERFVRELEMLHFEGNIDVGEVKYVLSRFASYNINEMDLVKLLSLDYNVINKERYLNSLEIFNDIYSVEDLKNIYGSCTKISKLKKIRELMDITQTSFSPSYSVSTAYSRYRNLNILDLSSLEVKRKSLINYRSFVSERFGLSEDEATKIERLLVKYNITSEEDLMELKSTLEELGLPDYVSALDKILRGSKGDIENLVKDLLPEVRSAISISAFQPSYCDALMASQNVFRFDVVLNGYMLLEQGFDAERIFMLNAFQEELSKYEEVISSFSDIEYTLEDIERCSRIVDFRKVLLSLLFYSSETFNPDFLSMCYYSSYSSWDYEAFVYNNSGLSIALFKYPLAKSFEQYEVVYHPYAVLKSNENIFSSYADAVDYLNSNRDVLKEIRNKIKDSVLESEEKTFEFYSLSCGECEFLPNPLKRISKEDSSLKIKEIFEMYKDVINLTLLDIEILEEVVDESQALESGCLCSKDNLPKEVMRVCITKYSVNRKSNVYALYTYQGVSFVVEFNL